MGHKIGDSFWFYGFGDANEIQKRKIFIL
jgi:hypothetical protein